jgi:glycosyltransferase involved in cell wall biosynthesis
MGYLSKFRINDFVNKLQKRSKNDEKISYPKISIITASYNQGAFIERTLLSVLNQNYPNIEIIIIDGGSTDNTIEIIKKYEPYISYWVSEKDNGQADAINKGFKIASGDLLCFQNSDDLFCQNSFLTLATFYQKRPNNDCYYGDMIFIDTNDNVLEVLKTNNFNIKAQILEGMQVFNQSLFFKKSIGEQFGYLDSTLKFVIDYENILRWAKNGAKFVKVPNLIGAFRLHEEAKTHNLENIRKSEHEKVRNEYFQLYFKNKKPNKLVYTVLRINKILYFVKNLDFQYIFYRFLLKK